MNNFRLLVRLYDGVQLHEISYRLVEEPDRKMIDKCVADAMAMNLRVPVIKTEVVIIFNWHGLESST